MDKMVQVARTPGNKDWLWGRGWGQQIEHTNWLDEQMSWKKSCYIGDWSFLQFMKVKGTDAIKLFSSIFVNSFAKFEVGQAKHIIMCNDDGYIMMEGILIRLSEDEYAVEGIPPFWLMTYLPESDYNVETEMIPSYFWQVQGPNSLELLEDLTGEDLKDIKFMHYRYVTIAGKKVIALRQGMSGEVGFELQGPMEDMQTIRDAVMAAGQKFGILEIGGRVAMINHLEACFPTLQTEYVPAFTGKDVELLSKIEFPLLTVKVEGSFESDNPEDYFRTPYDFGWGNRVKFDHDFRGRAALEEMSKNIKRQIVTLEWNTDDVIDVYASLYREGDHYDYIEMPRTLYWVSHMDKVVNSEDKPIGTSASYGYSYFFRKNLSLCVIDNEYATPGTEVTLIWGEPGHPQKKIRAVVASAPYKKDDRRTDLRKTH